MAVGYFTPYYQRSNAWYKLSSHLINHLGNSSSYEHGGLVDMYTSPALRNHCRILGSKYR